MGSSCSSGQKDKDGKKKLKKGKGGTDPTPRGSNASNSSVYVYQKAATPPPAAEIPALSPPQSIPVYSEHTVVQKTDSLLASPTLPSQDTLPTFNEYPDHVRHLLLGNIKSSAPPLIKPRKIVLFLCADFADTVKERAVVVEQVIPKVRRSCAERGYELSIVDWELRDDTKGLGVQYLQRQTQHCHLVPVVFLNETLGQRSLPPKISPDLKQHLLETIKSQSEKELFTECYLLDENNSPPQYVLQNKGNEEDREKLLKILWPVWEDSELLETILDTFIQAVLSFDSQNDKNKCIWINRKFHGSQGSEAGALQKRLTALQSSLQSQVEENRKLQFSIRQAEDRSRGVETFLPEHAQYLDALSTKFHKVLNEIVDNIIDDAEKTSPDSGYLGMEKRLYHELNQQMKECKYRLKHFVGQTSQISKIEEYLKNDSKSPLIIHGPSGSGKSALAAKIVQKCSEKGEKTPIVFRFIGLTPDSATTEQVVRSICEQCCVLFGEHPSLASQNMLHLAKELPLLFNKVSPKRPLVVILDGIDQVQFYSSLSLAWVPANLAPHVKLILTLRDDCPQLSELKAFISEASSWLSMSSLTLADYKALEQCSLPLHAVVVAYEASEWSSWEQNQSLQGDVESQIVHVFKRLEEEFGSNTICKVMGYLTAAKHGLMDSEMVDLMSCDETLDPDQQKLTSLWIQIQNQLQFFLKTSLVGKLSVTHWGNWTFRSLAEQRYLGDEGLVSVSRFMVDYFQMYNRRKLDELPLHAHRSSGPIQCDFLFNADWLQAKVCGSDVYQLLEDLKMIESSPDVDLLREVIELSAYALSYDGSQLFSQIVARLPQPDANKYPRVASFYEMAKSNANSSNLMPLGLCLHSPGAREATPDTEIYFDSIHRIKGSITHMLTLAADKGIVNVVSIYEQKVVRTLVGVTQPRVAKMVDDHRALLLCNRELKLYDLETCSFEMKLKGVMNQKMPFYDLHDPLHVVSLSRNRMYVYMTNLTSGDCVATFKVGEDRFLNSLLVSANGKMCVCGDETQKPFPLLVWDMNSRKLVYDLRIPHHEFITRLAAITHDGHYVASVCKEVDDPSPNFIIVYDLQSGTLFKKWKPEVNTCSIAISSEGNCVITGLEDCTLLVWDLVTGACRFSLKGHCAPADHILMDDAGTVCVTFDSTGKDRSVRSWNILSGQVTAVFTPDSPIICCELSSDGRAVVLGLRGQREILTLLLCNRQSVDEAKQKNITPFGNPDNIGKVADVSEAG
uniref:NACHT domain-containing protein n=1 Tax=Strigamia maritima TaxID=126957 RepID=T1IHI5_STRMM